MPARTVVVRDARGAERRVEILEDGAVNVDGRKVVVVPMGAGEYRAGGCAAWAAMDSERLWVFIDGVAHSFDVRQGSPTRARAGARHPDALSAPMPATVIKIQVAPGDHVRAGDVVLVLEAMKMELPVRAPVNGVVQAVRCATGELVQPDQELIAITAEGS